MYVCVFFPPSDTSVGYQYLRPLKKSDVENHQQALSVTVTLNDWLPWSYILNSLCNLLVTYSGASFEENVVNERYLHLRDFSESRPSRSVKAKDITLNLPRGFSGHLTYDARVKDLSLIHI